MSETKFTPGPWRWQGEDYRGGWGWQMLVDANGAGIIVGQGLNGGPESRLRAHMPVDPALCITGLLADGKPHVQPVHVLETAAPLITAAPEMYEALVLAREAIMRTAAAEGYTDVTADEWPLLARIDAALQRARGETP